MPKPTLAQGEAALKGVAAAMQALCDSCCQDCPPAKCKKEAQAIGDAIVAAWKGRFGLGSNDSKDNIGGYLCWDWARFFTDAAKATKPTCWTVEAEMAWKGAPPAPGTRQVCHFWAAFYACQKKDACKIMVDDSWFDGNFIHSPPFPGAGWPPGKLPLPAETPKR